MFLKKLLKNVKKSYCNINNIFFFLIICNFVETNPKLDNIGILNLLEKNAFENGNNDPRVTQAIHELNLLLDYADIFNCTPHRIVFDPSLARGLDYYTGAIYEVVIKSKVIFLIF